MKVLVLGERRLIRSNVRTLTLGVETVNGVYCVPPHKDAYVYSSDRPARPVLWKNAPRTVWRPAAMQYSIQGLNCDDPERKDLLMDIGTEELSHAESS